jgi:putative glutamine amidotransferase
MRPRIGITSAPTVHDGRRIDRVSRWYVDAIRRAGALPFVLPTLEPEDAKETLAALDGLVLTGGGDVAPWLYGAQPAPEVYDVDRARDSWELALIRAAGDRLPVLGICRGAQLLNVAAGGTLFQHLPDVTDEPHRLRERDREPVHVVDIEPGSRLGEILGQGRVGVNSVHHQAVDRVGSGLRAVAWARDGIVEAVERSDGAPVVAVQWHPESLIDLAPHGRLFLWLTRTAARRRPGLQVPEVFEPAGTDTAGLGHVVDDVA